MQQRNLCQSEERMTNNFDTVLTGFDKILKEVVSNRQEILALTHRQDETDKRLDATEATPAVADDLS